MFYLTYLAVIIYSLSIKLLITGLGTDKKTHIYFYFPLIITLALIVGSRQSGVDHDYDNYITWISEVSGSLSEVISQGKDIGFILIYSFTSLFDNSYVLFFTIIAFLSIFFKVKFSNQVFEGRFYIIIFLMIFSRFFIIHDFTQIRGGLAISLTSYGVLKLINNDKSKGIVYSILGVTIHLSVLLIPIVFIAYKLVCNRKFLKTFLIILPLVGIFLGEAFKSLLPFIDSARINVYLSGQYLTEQVSLLSFYYLIRFFIFYSIMIFFYSRIKGSFRIYIFYASASLFLHAAFSWNDAISLRLVEVLGFFDMAMLILPLLYINRNSRIIYYIFLAAVSFIFFSSSTKIVHTYSSYLF